MLPLEMTTDYYINTNGSLTLDRYREEDVNNPEAEPEESLEDTFENLAIDFVDSLKGDSDTIDSHECVQAAYNALDSLRKAIETIEDALHEDV